MIGTSMQKLSVALSREPTIENTVTTLKISGRIPSKKNSRISFVRFGKMYNLPSKAYTVWQKEALTQLPNNIQLTNICCVTINLWAPDKRSADLSNKAESIMDLLVDKGILIDDNWFIVPKLVLVFKGIDRDNPRVELIIESNNGLPK